MKTKTRLPTLIQATFICLTLFSSFQAQTKESYTRIVDVGAGFCSITRLPNNQFLLYDAGNWSNKNCLKAVREVVQDNPIHLAIFSHSDGDHIGNAAEILEEFNVRNIIRTGFERTTKTYLSMIDAINEEIANGSGDIHLKGNSVRPGATLKYGDVTLTFLSGSGQWTQSRLSKSESRNAISIVVKLEYDGKSILFTGDTIGRRLSDSNDACKDAEQLMVKNHHRGISLRSTILIAPHHGGNNGSSTCFLQAVNPEYVIFPAGHKHGHPSQATVDRILKYTSVTPENIYRTDLNDRESKTNKDWEDDSIPGCYDLPGDDDIEISLTKGIKKPTVKYRDDNDLALCKKTK